MGLWRYFFGISFFERAFGAQTEEWYNKKLHASLVEYGSIKMPANGKNYMAEARAKADRGKVLVRKIDPLISSMRHLDYSISRENIKMLGSLQLTDRLGR